MNDEGLTARAGQAPVVSVSVVSKGREANDLHGDLRGHKDRRERLNALPRTIAEVQRRQLRRFFTLRWLRATGYA